MARTSAQSGSRAEHQGEFQPPEGYLPIEDYGVIGDLQTAALVGRNGSIDWCAIPDFESPGVFGALLDVKKGGVFRIAPPETSRMKRTQWYIPETNILVTRCVSADRVVGFVDEAHVFMELLAVVLNDNQQCPCEGIVMPTDLHALCSCGSR